MEIVKIEPRWNNQWANDPDIIVEVDNKLSWDEVLWDAVPDPDAREKTMLLSTNCDPWVRFVYIANPNGHPNMDGALGGPYHMTDGTVFNSRTGWSSRAGVINRDFKQFLRNEDEIVDVTIRSNQYSLLAGFNVYRSHIINHPAWPKDLHLVRKLQFTGGEPYHIISTDPDSVVKGGE